MVQRKVIVRGATNQALDELDVADLPDLSASFEVAGAVAAHAGDGTGVHGITDTADLIVEGDARLTDARTPTAHAASHNGGGDAVTPAGIGADVAGAAAAAAAASQPLDSDLTAIAALTTTAFGRSFLDRADAAAARTILALGTAALAATGDFDAAGAAAAAQAASQPLDSDLTAIAALTTTAYGRAFLALADAAAGRTALGLGTAALNASGDFDAAGAAAAAQAASQPLDSDLTAIAALTTTAFGRALLELADAAALAAAHTHAGGLTLTPLVKDLGVSLRSGTFDITGLSGLTIDKPVLVTQTAAPIASKGNARDEMEFDAIQASGYVVDATTIRVYWNASGVVVGDYAFGYTVSG